MSIYYSLPSSYKASSEPKVIIPYGVSTVGEGSCQPKRLAGSPHKLLVYNGKFSSGGVSVTAQRITLDFLEIDLLEGEWDLRYDVTLKEVLATQTLISEEPIQFLRDVSATSSSDFDFPEKTFRVGESFSFRNSNWLEVGDSISFNLSENISSIHFENLPDYLVREGNSVRVKTSILLPEGISLSVSKVTGKFKTSNFVNVLNPVLSSAGSNTKGCSICSFTYEKDGGIVELRDLREIITSAEHDIAMWVTTYLDQDMSTLESKAGNYLKL